MPAATATLPSPSVLAAPLPPVWADPRFRLPLALVGATALAVGTFTVLHFALRKTWQPPDIGTPDERGFRFPDAGYLICPQSEGLVPTRKDIGTGSIIVVSLGSATGQIVEPAWARVVEVDAKDKNRISVVLVGQTTTTGQKDLQTDRHGFRLAQKLWVTKDCVWDVLRLLDDPGGRLLCGAELVAFAAAHADLTDKPGFAPVPGAVKDLVGRKIELYLVSKAGAGTAWQIPVVAEITGVGNTGHIATVKVTAFGRNEWAEAPPPTGHTLAPGQTFDITWDCVLAYL